ncbi:MAG: ABC transporter permease [Blastocatellia bacterium]|nr:ABC transporter permease [Blastocatellia bacterium]
MEFLVTLLKTGIPLATPLALVALGEIISERAGVLNIGVEGIMLCGAFAGVAVTFWLGNPWLGLCGAVVAGITMAVLFGVLAVSCKADQVMIGTGLNMLALGGTGVARREVFGLAGETLTVPSLPPLPLPGLKAIPGLGRIFFEQDALVYVTMGLIPLISYWLFRTEAGLALRAVGENPEAADSLGLDVAWQQWQAVWLCGALCGLAGGYLSLGLANTFVEGMTAGRGFIALAIVIVSRWNPWGAGLGALLFGTASALQYRFQATGWTIPFQLFLALPYGLTLIVAALLSRRGGQPAALGKSYIRE